MSDDDGGVATAAIGDAFGEALWECFEAGGTPGVTPQIIERDDGFIEANDMALYFETPEAWNELDRWACESLTGRVLDVGAGAGRHALFLQERGCQVTALDTSPRAVEVCNRRGVRDAFTGTVEEFAASDPEKFDAFTLLGNNLGLLRDSAYGKEFLHTLASIARPGATLVGTCIDPYTTQHAEHLAYHEANRSAGRMAGQVRIRIRYRGLATPWWEYLFLSLDELRDLIAETRWALVDHRSSGVLYAVRMRLQ